MLNSGLVFFNNLKTAADFADQRDMRGFFRTSRMTFSTNPSSIEFLFFILTFISDCVLDLSLFLFFRDLGGVIVDISDLTFCEFFLVSFSSLLSSSVKSGLISASKPLPRAFSFF